MRAPVFTQQLSAEGLLHTARQVFGKIPDAPGHMTARVDHLMSAGVVRAEVFLAAAVRARPPGEDDAGEPQSTLRNRARPECPPLSRAHRYAGSEPPAPAVHDVVLPAAARQGAGGR